MVCVEWANVVVFSASISFFTHIFELNETNNFADGIQSSMCHTHRYIDKEIQIKFYVEGKLSFIFIKKKNANNASVTIELKMSLYENFHHF